MNIPDPYNSILQRMQNQGKKFNPPSIDIGKVISIDPLVININNLPLKKENILISDFLLPNYKRKISIPSTNATGSTTNGSISNISISDAELNFTDYGFKKDDMLACLATSDEQTYIVLFKVVAL